MRENMPKVLIMYYSKYGSTKKYAEWISEELSADIFGVNDFNQKTIQYYDIIILGSALYAGNIKGINLLVKNYENLKGKTLVIYTCGVADYKKIENINSVNKRLENEIPKYIFENIKIFNLRGDINYKKLSISHKIMMGMLKKMVMKKKLEEMDEENKEFLETYGKSTNFMDKNNIMEIIDYCKKHTVVGNIA
jgi:menaquinone-dependent protoporphyrinogen IX oxidase